MITFTRPKHILVVEDNPGDVQLIRDVFEHTSHVAWHFVHNLIQARDYVHQRAPYDASPRPDMIILDLRLPLCPGYSLIPIVKTDPTLRNIRIVVFTSSTDPRDKALCTHMGADAYVIKPSTLPEWIMALAGAIEEEPPTPA